MPRQRESRELQSGNMADDSRESPRCALDENNCLKLSCILKAFNAPISEEQAWAVCFQSAKCMVNEWNSDSDSCYCLSDTSHIFIHKDGTIHRSTVRLPVIDGINRKLASSEYMLVASLGVIIFNALDYGLCHDEERKLSPPLECLIDRMTSATSISLDGDNSAADDDDGDCDSSSNSLNADEGIEQDSGEDDHEKIFQYSDDESEGGSGKRKNGLTLVRVMEMCASHLSCPGQADCHFKAVCRALVAEALELSSFLENISNGTKALLYADQDETDSRTLEKLKIQDWARLWMQVIQQLRQGVKLKKVDPAHFAHPIEYELTPYEMLLDDIRSRRYKLRQVMVNGDIPPRVKKDAHALILEFIRSRPPLVPVSRRKLPPTPPRQLTLYEKLMQSIRQQHKLKPTGRSEEVETSRTKLQDTDVTPQPHRRLIKPDLSLRLSSSFEDDDGDDIPPTPREEPASMPVQNGVPSHGIVRSNSHSGAPHCSDRRHSISVCESPPKPCNGTPSSGSSRNLSRSARSDYWKSSQWQSLECLSLTLEEVVHIRNVLTKAELESLIVDPVLYDSVLKGKICFTCKQTRFAFFGPWGIKCKMCERTVCDKCSSKMRIPTEHFSRIPVYMLSPTPSPPPEEESSHSAWKLSEVFTFGSGSDQQTTPKIPRQASIFGAKKQRHSFPHSESLHLLARDKLKRAPSSAANSTPSFKRAPLQRAKTIQHPCDADVKAVNGSSSTPGHVDRRKGPLVPVCRECKIMVCNIIKASTGKKKDDKKQKNSRTWPQKKAPPPLSGPSNSCMSPLAETPLSSPDDVFFTHPAHATPQHITSVV